jgi:hypothetical protein
MNKEAAAAAAQAAAAAAAPSAPTTGLVHTAARGAQPPSYGFMIDDSGNVDPSTAPSVPTEEDMLLQKQILAKLRVTRPSNAPSAPSDSPPFSRLELPPTYETAITENMSRHPTSNFNKLLPITTPELIKAQTALGVVLSQCVDMFTQNPSDATESNPTGTVTGFTECNSLKKLKPSFTPSSPSGSNAGAEGNNESEDPPSPPTQEYPDIVKLSERGGVEEYVINPRYYKSIGVGEFEGESLTPGEKTLGKAVLNDILKVVHFINNTTPQGFINVKTQLGDR